MNPDTNSRQQRPYLHIKYTALFYTFPISKRPYIDNITPLPLLRLAGLLFLQTFVTYYVKHL